MFIILIGQLNMQHRRPRHDGPARARLRYLPHVISITGFLTGSTSFKYGGSNFLLFSKAHCVGFTKFAYI